MLCYVGFKSQTRECARYTMRWKSGGTVSNLHTCRRTSVEPTWGQKQVGWVCRDALTAPEGIRCQRMAEVDEQDNDKGIMCGEGDAQTRREQVQGRSRRTEQEGEEM